MEIDMKKAGRHVSRDRHYVPFCNSDLSVQCACNYIVNILADCDYEDTQYWQKIINNFEVLKNEGVKSITL